VLRGETIQSMLPWDIPWWLPDYAMFFGTFYLVLGVIGSGVLFAVLKSLRDARKDAKEYD
jgi:hypothetical protein